MAKPTLPRLWAAFPDHVQYPTLESLFGFLGGGLKRNIHEKGFGPKGNTCAVRISRCLNYGGMPLSWKLCQQLDLNPLSGSDKRPYLFRVSEMKKYLAKALGRQTASTRKNFHAAFADRPGIVTYDVIDWSDATGHIALWDGKAFREPAFDDFRDLKDDPATVAKEAQTTRLTLWAL